MSHTNRLKRMPDTFRQLTGITPAAFDQLLTELEPLYQRADAKRKNSGIASSPVRSPQVKEFRHAIAIGEPVAGCNGLRALTVEGPASRGTASVRAVSSTEITFSEPPMWTPADPLRESAAQDAHASASSDRDETGISSGNVPARGFGAPAAAGEVGTLGPYRVLKELGKGGMGAVYLALDPRLERQLALKVMLPEFATNRDAKERFLREARAAAKISHDNVVIIHEADERAGVPYIAMQFLQGYPLNRYLKTKGAPALPHVIRIVREAALGLAAAHAMGLVHRDIKPANLWLEAPNGRVKVLDFGLAKPVGSESELTKSGAVVGTPAYMSPEQARGLKVDARTDLFSLGAVLYRLCTGQNPFQGEHVMAVLAALMTADPAPVRELNPNVPEPLARLTHQLLAKKPEDRPQTANDVAKRLRAILQLLTPSAVAEALVPMAVDDSASLPVVVHAVPHQPPVVVPMSVTAQPEIAFADLSGDGADPDATEAYVVDSASRAVRKKGGGKGLLWAVCAVVLAVVTLGAVLLQVGQKKKTEANTPGVGTPGGTKEETDPKSPIAPSGPFPAAYTNSIGMKFVLVPKGTGYLGGGANKQGGTKVVFSQDFYLGQYEVTQEEWEVVTGGLTPSRFSRQGPDADAVKGIGDAELKRFPVEGVSWDDSEVFIEQLNKKEAETGWAYRLPKAWEWEYACRGGPGDMLASAFDFYFAQPTNTLLPELANFKWEIGLKRTCKVGSYEPNSLGLYDMHGNVHEWCEDAATGADGASRRVSWGGSWHSGSWDCRARSRYTFPPSYRNNFLGLRLARVPSVPAGK